MGSVGRKERSQMRLSMLLGKRLKEKPSDAVIASHTFLIRGGYARQIARGIYSLLPAARRITHKIETIIREEMDRIGGQEVLLPIVIPAELLDESGRYGSAGPELVRFEDRTGRGLVLGMTHEEAVVQLCRSEVESYKQLPFMVYQIQEKFRYEARPRGGLIRAREFTMKDAYSFHAAQEDLDDYYETCKTAYRRIFARAGIPETAIVESNPGMMGGNTAHQFMLLCDAGEDTIMSCPHCGYLANLDVATGRIEGFAEGPQALEQVKTPGQQTIEGVANYLKVPTRKVAKVVFYDRDDSDRLVLAVVRGDIEINEAKLARIIRREPVLAEHDRITSFGAVPGFASLLDVNPDRCRIVVDHSVAGSNNLVCGANKVDWHMKNFNLAREVPNCQTLDIAKAREGDGCPHCSKPLGLQRGIEVGSIRQLGTKYSQAMGMRYIDKDGNARAPLMGSYGIGVGRLMAAVMEAHRDGYGPIWPMSIAPWHVHIVAIGAENQDVARAAEALYDDLGTAGIETVWDDRNERAGVQFADADLLGVPLRIVIGAKTLAKGGVELLRRGERAGQIVTTNEVVGLVRRKIHEDLQGLSDSLP